MVNFQRKKILEIIMENVNTILEGIEYGSASKYKLTEIVQFGGYSVLSI